MIEGILMGLGLLVLIVILVRAFHIAVESDRQRLLHEEWKRNAMLLINAATIYRGWAPDEETRRKDARRLDYYISVHKDLMAGTLREVNEFVETEG